MAFWSNLTSRLFSAKSNNPDWGTLERYLGWAFGGGVSSSGVVVNPQNAMQAAVVYSCCKVLAESVGMLPCCIYTQGEGVSRTPNKGHPLWELLVNQPNEYQTAVEFFEMLTLHLNMRGNAYGYINRTRSGRIVEIIPLHPDYVNVRMDETNTVTYQVGTEQGGMRLLDRSEILHVKGLTLNGWLGISPIAYARESIGLSLATEKFGGQLFRNGAKMGGVLEAPAQLSDVAYDRLKTSFDLATSGENAHKTAVLEEGVKFTKIGMMADEAQFLETRKYQRAEIAGLFRVPAHMVNDLEKATFSNISSLDLQFLKYSLRPWLRRLTACMRRDLFSVEDKRSQVLDFDVSSLLYADAASRSTYYHQMVLDGIITRNEARGMEGLNPIDGLDVPLMPLNMGDGTEDPDEDVDNAEGAGQDSKPPKEEPKP